MQNMDEGKKCSAEHCKEMKGGKKHKYGKKNNISLKDFKDVQNTKQYKSEMKKIIAKATEAKTEVNEKVRAIASLLKSEVEKQVTFAAGTKLSASAATRTSNIEFCSAIGAILKSKDKVRK